MTSEPVPGIQSAGWSRVVHDTKLLLEQNPVRGFRTRLQTSLPLSCFAIPTDHLKHASVDLSYHPGEWLTC